MEAKFIDFFEKNVHRLNQAEQDILNLCCYPKIKYLPCKTLVCSYFYDLYKSEEDFKNDIQYTETELRAAHDAPIQLHYATSTKPWKDVNCMKSEEWFKYLIKTPFLMDHLMKPNKKIENKYRVKMKKEFNCTKKYKILFEIRKQINND